MSNRNRNIIYSILLIMVVIVVYFYREQTAPSPTQNIHIMGTAFGVVPYNVKYIDTQERKLKHEVDSVLNTLNQSLSTYVPNSEISRFNAGESFVFESPFFYPMLEACREIHEKTDGAFDPTVGPLVNAWGFGPGKSGRESRPSPNVDSLMQLVGFDKIKFDEREVQKSHPGVSLDFSAIAKGYGVDLVAEYLSGQGIADYMVEVGGEVACRGYSVNGRPWTIGIDNPSYAERGGSSMATAIRLTDQAMATSGNYRNAYEKDGQKYTHTINPKTGYSVRHDLLSVSVIAENCTLADAYATAFMVMGYDEAKKMAQNMGFQLVLIYHEDGEDKIYYSPELEEQLVK